MQFVGTVDWFGSKKQTFGFINYVVSNEHAQVYVHYKNIGTSNLRSDNFRNGKWFREVKRGDVVSFEIAKGFGMPDGTQAINVEILIHAVSR